MSAEIELLIKILVESTDRYTNREDTDPSVALWAALLEQHAKALDCGARA